MDRLIRLDCGVSGLANPMKNNMEFMRNLWVVQGLVGAVLCGVVRVVGDGGA